MKKIILITCLAALPFTSFAEGSKFNLGAKLSTLGPGLDLTYKINSKLSTRFNINGLNKKINKTDVDINVSGNAKLSTTGILLDYHPFSKGLRLTAGIYNNKNALNISASGATGKIDIDGTEYDVNGGSLDTSIGFKSTAPYFGLGWSSQRKGLNFFADAGILMQGSPDINITPDTSTLLVDNGAGGVVAILPGSAEENKLNQDIQDEEDKINDDANAFKALPVLSLGISYNF